MPTVDLPLSGYENLQFNATFRARGHSDVDMVANFTNPFISADLGLSGLFFAIGTKNLNQTATFKSTTTLSLSANFQNPKSIINLPLTAHFYVNSATSDLLSGATFLAKHDLTITSTFRKSVNRDLLSSARFVYKNTLPVTSTFRVANSKTLRMGAFLGRFKSSIPSYATFIVPSFTDFSASISIQTYEAPKEVQFGTSTDFAANIFIKGIVHHNFPMYATFAIKSANDFPGTITIRNKYHGGGNIPITVSGGVQITATSDASGYFHIDNLVPGEYQITPVAHGIVFSPPTIDVIITNSNVTLYFNANGSFVDKKLVPVPLQPLPLGTCTVEPGTGNAGTFSIDGFILPQDTSGYESIIVTSTDETEGFKFRRTFLPPNNLGI